MLLLDLDFYRLQEFGYQVIPVNPFAVGKKINGENVVAQLEDITTPIDIVDVFRRSSAVLPLAGDLVAAGPKVMWLQQGVVNVEAAQIVSKAGIKVVMDTCIMGEHRSMKLGF